MATGTPTQKQAAGLLSSWIRYYSDDQESAITSYKQLDIQEFSIDFLWAE